MRSFTFAFVFALSLLFAPMANAQSDSLLKTNDIRILLNLMDVGPAMRLSLIDEIAAGRASNESGLPPSFWDEFEKEAMNSVPAFLERLIPTYDEHLTHAEIKTLITIYQNPAMKKLNASQSSLSAAAGKAGEAWGEEIGMRVAKKIDSAEEPAEALPGAQPETQTSNASSNKATNKPNKKK